MKSSGGSQSRHSGFVSSIGDSSKTTQPSSLTSATNNGTANTSASNANNANNASSGGAVPSKIVFPPPSQPLLEGGSGADGHSMGMSSIAEEKDSAEQL